jgi:hypothetical protein
MSTNRSGTERVEEVEVHIRLPNSKSEEQLPHLDTVHDRVQKMVRRLACVRLTLTTPQFAKRRCF